MKKPIVIVGLSLMAMLAAACNTVEGAGEDVEAAGSAIDQAAEDAGAN
ncbi:entericidin A/B family lipoprotein [Henriciella litoralis]|nr:entericidin A/B family lipoprotein [Henriciella litoralis]